MASRAIFVFSPNVSFSHFPSFPFKPSHSGLVLLPPCQHIYLSGRKSGILTCTRMCCLTNCLHTLSYYGNKKQSQSGICFSLPCGDAVRLRLLSQRSRSCRHSCVTSPSVTLVPCMSQTGFVRARLNCGVLGAKNCKREAQVIKIKTSRFRA